MQHARGGSFGGGGGDGVVNARSCLIVPRDVAGVLELALVLPPFPQALPLTAVAAGAMLDTARMGLVVPDVGCGSVVNSYGSTSDDKVTKVA